jgi:hypothetical protein
MASSTDTPNIYTLFSKCISHFDAIIHEAKRPSNKLKQSFPLEADVSSSRQEFYHWGKSYGANLDPTSTISLDYKFRNKEYTRNTVQSHLGHLLDDLEGRKFWLVLLWVCKAMTLNSLQSRSFLEGKPNRGTQRWYSVRSRAWWVSWNGSWAIFQRSYGLTWRDGN